MHSRISPLFRVAAGVFLCAASSVHAQAAETPPAAQPAQPEFSHFDLSAAVVSGDGGLTAAEAGKRARARSPRIAAARAAAASAEWDAGVAWAGFLPTLNAYATYKRVNYVDNQFGFFNPDSVDVGTLMPATVETLGVLQSATSSNSSSFVQPVNQYSLGATLRYPVSDLFLRTYYAYEGAKGVTEAQAVQIEVAASLVDNDARAAFYDYARAVAQLAVASQAVRQAEAQAAQIQLFVNAGTSAQVDALTATARVEQARGAEARARGTVASTQSRLATLTGAETADIGPIGEPVLEAPKLVNQDRDALVKRALEQRPELRALRKLLHANDKQRIAQRNAALPQLVLDGSAMTAKPNPRYIPINQTFKPSWEVGGSILWSPNNALLGYQTNKKFDASIAKVRADLMNQEDGVRIEVVNAHEELKSALAVAAAAEAQLAAAEEAYRVRTAMYQVGAGVIIDLLNADFTLTQARLDHANATIGARLALATLQRVAVLDRE